MGTKKVDIKFLNPVIEVAGPTPQGYKLLDMLGITLPKSFIITNVEDSSIYFSGSDEKKKYSIDQIVDVRELPYKEAEVGTFLCSNLLFTGYSEATVHDVNKVIEEYEEAIRTKASHGINLRIRFLIDAHRCLKSKGLLIMQGAHSEDVRLAKALGYEVLLFRPGRKYFDGLILRKK